MGSIFTRAIPLEATGRCPRCKSPSFEAVLMKSNASLGMEIVFYKRAIPDDLQHPGYDSPVLSVSIPPNYRVPNKMRLNTLVSFSKSKLVARMWSLARSTDLNKSESCSEFR